MSGERLPSLGEGWFSESKWSRMVGRFLSHFRAWTWFLAQHPILLERETECRALVGIGILSSN